MAVKIEELDIPYEDTEKLFLAPDAKKKKLAQPGEKSEAGANFEKVTTIGEKGAIDRDEAYTHILNRYSENYDVNKTDTRNLRQKYYVLSVVIMVSLLVLGVGLLITIFFIDIGTVGSIVAAIAAFASVVSAMLTIPITVTKYLFPQELDHEIVDIVKCMIENDCEIRKIASKEQCLNCKVNQESK